MITTKNLGRMYKLGKVPVHALKGVDITVKTGEFVSVMGPSGSGKSTLLHQLGAIDIPTTGKVYINGTEVTNLPHKRRADFRLKNIGLVFQFYSLLPELTAQENVALPSMIAGNQKQEALKQAAKILRQLRLGERLLHKPDELSGGEQQRVAIARALVNKPKVLLADEPTANLDFKTGKEVVQVFRELNRKNKQTIVLVTHEQPYGKMADRIIYLRDGKIERH